MFHSYHQGFHASWAVQMLIADQLLLWSDIGASPAKQKVDTCIDDSNKQGRAHHALPKQSQFQWGFPPEDEIDHGRSSLDEGVDQRVLETERGGCWCKSNE